jgi:S-DNA-T family DNA segregation ATPase FtsK/SpoIIIE
MVGAYLADAMLQLIGVAAFFLPLVLGRLGICWMRSRPAGSPLAKTIGLGMWVVFAPAAIALLPGAMLWQRSLPVEGTLGRLLADFMVHYLNLPGAAIVLTLMVAVSLYLATTFTFNTAREWATARFGFVQRLWDWWAQRRSRRANDKAAFEEVYGSKREQAEAKARRARELAAEAQRKRLKPENTTLLGGLFGWLSRKKRGTPVFDLPGDAANPRRCSSCNGLQHRSSSGSALCRRAGEGSCAKACAR